MNTATASREALAAGLGQMQLCLQAADRRDPQWSQLGLSGHQSAKMKNDEWLTPPEIVSALGAFDLDPCSPINRPWATAAQHYTVRDDGLAQPWHGRVWCNA